MSLRWKIILQYDGSNYHGWQAQKDYPSIQGVMEKALKFCCQHPVNITVAGRTDAGVHALGQVIHVDLIRKLSSDRMRLAIQNHLKGHAITIVSVEPVTNNFHARFSAYQRHYQYRLVCSPTPPILLHKRVWWLPYSLNINLMHTAAQDLVGYHNFSNFRTSGCQANSPMRSIDVIDIQIERYLGSEIICLNFFARSFLYRQVRNMVGKLVEIGLKRRCVGEIKRLLLQTDNCRQNIYTAPAHGLYFIGVEYSSLNIKT